MGSRSALPLDRHIKYYESPDELAERLGLLCASKEAGNESTRLYNEIVEILTAILNNNHITESHYKKSTITI